MCAQEFKVYRFNKTGKKVVCGTLEIKDSKYSLWFNFNIIDKYIIKNFNYPINNEIDSFIHLVGREYWLNDFRRREKPTKRVSYSSRFKQITESIKEKIRAEEECKEREKELFRKQILAKNKNKIRLKVDIFEYESLGTFADLFTTVEDTETSISVFFEQEQLKVYKQKPKQASNFYKKQNITSDILALWDIENVNFYDDFRIITNLLPKESTKVFAYSKKNKDKIIYLKGNNLNFVLRKLKKRRWIEKRTIKSADNVLIEEFRQRKDKISHLYLITADKDFEGIATEAVNAGIKVTIMNKIDKASWFNCDLYDYLRV